MIEKLMSRSILHAARDVLISVNRELPESIRSHCDVNASLRVGERGDFVRIVASHDDWVSVQESLSDALVKFGLEGDQPTAIGREIERLIDQFSPYE